MRKVRTLPVLFIVNESTFVRSESKLIVARKHRTMLRNTLSQGSTVAHSQVVSSLIVLQAFMTDS